MITTVLGLSALLLALAVFAVVGFRARGGDHSLDDYVVARGSQGASSLALTFFASGLGAWILFAPPEIGVVAGIDAVVGYAIAAAAPIVLFAVLGPRFRRVVPSGQALTEFLRVRFGRQVSTFVAVISLLYMAVFLTAELVAVGGVASTLAGVPSWITVVAVAVVTLAYTAYGGLRASLRTDRWQGWLVLALLTVAAGAILAVLDDPAAAWRDSGGLGVDRPGVESAITLIIAVTAANLFHQGYWQRVWAAHDDRALRRGLLVGAAATVPVVLVAGILGMLAAGAGLVDVPALAVFALARPLPDVVTVAVLVLGVALVTSSVDTLENALVSLAVAERPRMRLRHARALTVLVMVPVTAVALVATSVLQLFLIADLLCAAIAVPALLGLWSRTTSGAAVAGGVAGLIGAIGAGWLVSGSAAGAWAAVTFPDAIPTLAPFAGAVVASTVVTVAWSLAVRRTTDLTSLEPAVRDRVVAGV